MKEQVEKIIKPIQDFWTKQSKKNRLIIAGVLAGALVIIVVLTIILNMQRYKVLYTGLKNSDSEEIIATLAAMEVPYKVEDDDSTILVPEDQVKSLRMEFATQGYPKSSPNYSLFEENIDIWTTDSERTQIIIYQLEQRLQQTIETLNPVKSAVVFINAPKDNGYVLGGDKGVPTASVKLELRSEIGPQQVNGIKRLVAQSGVPNLTAENVAVIDSNGNELSAELEEEASQVSLTEFKTQIEREFQQDIEKKVKTLLGSVYGGADHVEVVASVNMDVDKKIQEIITYIPSEEGDNTGVIVKEETNTEMQVDPETPGGIPGTDTNTDISTYPNVTVEGNLINVKDEKSYEYLVSQVTEQIQKEAAELKSVTIGITIDKQNMDEQEKQDVLNLVSKATNTAVENIAVMNYSFSIPHNPVQTDPEPGPWFLSGWRLYVFIGAIGFMLILLTLTTIFILKSRANKRRLLELQQLEMLEQDQDEFEELKPLGSETSKSKSKALQDEIKRFAETNPEIVAQLIRSWLKDEDID